MNKILCTLAVVLGLAITFMAVLPMGSAQARTNVGEIIPQPICFKLRNEAPYGVNGSFVTDYYKAESGSMRRHKSNFRLKAAGTKHKEKGYPLDVAEFCSSGPFYPDRKLEFVIRTLIPIFSCMTRIDQGDIVIKGHRKPEGGTETTAKCF